MSNDVSDAGRCPTRGHECALDTIFPAGGNDAV